MKVVITQEWLVFYDTENEEVKEYIKQNELYSLIEKGKLQVNGKPEQLYMMLYHLSQDNDIELI